MARQSSEVDSELIATASATLSQLAHLFETDAKTLPKRLKGISPSGTRKGYKVYNIREAASCIVRPSYEIEEYIRQMSPQELPPLLSKEFWNGQKARLAYEKDLGNHWPTEDVIELFSVLEQGIRQSLILVIDQVEREETFTDRQRKVFKRMMDSAITTFSDKLSEKFEGYYANRPEPADLTRRVLTTEDDEEVDI